MTDRLSERLSLSPRPTAILCITDRLALGVLDAAQRTGLRVPDDLSIVGFDDIPRVATVRPPLTTLRRKKGYWRGVLVALLRGEQVAATTALPVQLVVRGTTSATPAGKK